MHRIRTTGLLLVGTAAALVAGGGTALANDATPPDQPPITITLPAEQSAQLCDERIPRLLERLSELEERLGADATTVGSTARLAARIERAEEEGRTELVEQLDDRLDRRAALPDRIDELETRIVEFRDDNCVA